MSKLFNFYVKKKQLFLSVILLEIIEVFNTYVAH